MQTAEGMAEWLHWRVRQDLGIPATQGRRYSWGYPAIPEQAEHEKVYRLLDLRTASGCGCRAASRWSPSSPRSRSSPTIPRRSTSAPRAGACCPRATAGGADDVIKGSPRDPSRFGELDDGDPELDAAPGPALAGI